MTVFEREAEEVRDFLQEVPELARQGERTLAEKAGAVLSRYETRLERAGVGAQMLGPARYAQAVRIDQAVRSTRRVRLSVWMAVAHGHLFDRRDITPDTIRDFRDTASGAGPDYSDLAVFLTAVVDELEGRRNRREGVSTRPARLFLAGAAALVLALSLYAAFLDYRYHARLMSSFEAAWDDLPPADHMEERLGHLADLSAQVGRASDAAPLSALVTVPLWESGPRARQRYRDEVNAELPKRIIDALGEALATEGENLAQYDTLRAAAILRGEAAWAPAFLSGWLEERDVSWLTRHVDVLDGPFPELPALDPELVAQAKDFAADVPEPDRAFLELARASDVRALPPWDPVAHVRGLDEVLVRRSGLPLSAGVEGLHTEDGWRFAEDVAIGVAVQTARAEALRLFGDTAGTDNDTPDFVRDRLQAETLSKWKTFLADLRVRPFTDQQSAVRISGALAQRNSPLEGLLRAVWRQTGGTDRTRPHEMQLRIAAAFGPMIQYVERGSISELSALFGALNVALGTVEVDEERGADRLMSLQERQQSVSALKAAPPLVVQIAEDVLAQTSAAHSSLLTNPLTRAWQQRVYPLCARVVNGRYPFHDGSDADLVDFVDLLGPDGALTRFVSGFAGSYLDTRDDLWRWRPEARLSGVSQESAQFLQAAMALASGFFSPEFGGAFEIAALAEKGETTVAVGGFAAPVRASGVSQTIAWPGPDPAAGAEVAIRQGGGAERMMEPGPWGFLRILDAARIRFRDDGRRQLVDLRHGGGRLFFEMTFAEALNPVSARRLAKGLTCPPVL